MRIMIISIIFLHQFILLAQLNEEEIKKQTIEFSNKLITNPDSLITVLQNEDIIVTDSILERKHLDRTIEFYRLIINAQKRNNFFLAEFKIQPADIYQNKMVILYYKKNDNIFYNFYALFFGNGCNNNVKYIFTIEENSIIFDGINICQHMDPSGLDD